MFEYSFPQTCVYWGPIVLEARLLYVDMLPGESFDKLSDFDVVWLQITF